MLDLKAASKSSRVSASMNSEGQVICAEFVVQLHNDLLSHLLIQADFLSWRYL